MRFFPLNGQAAVRIGLACMALLAGSHASAQPLPPDPASDPIVVADRPLKAPGKHRTVKAGEAKPKTYISKQQPLVKTLRQTRSAP